MLKEENPCNDDEVTMPILLNITSWQWDQSDEHNLNNTHKIIIKQDICQ